MRRLLLTMSIAYAGPAVFFALNPQSQEQAVPILATLAGICFALAWGLHSMREQGRAQ